MVNQYQTDDPDKDRRPRREQWDDRPTVEEVFPLACRFVMMFGKHKGKPLDDIGHTDDGLLYLDWLLGQAWFKDPARRAVSNYLNHPTVSHRINPLLEGR